MCNIVVINRGEKEIGTPREFIEHFGFAPDEDMKQINIDECLCNCDIEKTLTNHKIEFKNDWGDIYVGMLDKIV